MLYLLLIVASTGSNELDPPRRCRLQVHIVLHHALQASLERLLRALYHKSCPHAAYNMQNKAKLII
jgi:hypothetical protein